MSILDGAPVISCEMRDAVIIYFVEIVIVIRIVEHETIARVDKDEETSAVELDSLNDILKFLCEPAVMTDMTEWWHNCALMIFS